MYDFVFKFYFWVTVHKNIILYLNVCIQGYFFNLYREYNMYKRINLKSFLFSICILEFFF